MSDDFVDLTIGDSDGERQPRRKRQRSGHEHDAVVLLERSADVSDEIQVVGSAGGAQRKQPDDEVQVVEPEGSAHHNPPKDLDDGEELKILTERGEVWNRTLAHSRHQCGQKPFSRTKSKLNKEHCDKCYCFICDERAPCAFWGDGTLLQDHANSHPGMDWYRQQRAQHRRRKGIEGRDPLLDAQAQPDAMGLSRLELHMQRMVARAFAAPESPGRDVKPAKPPGPSKCMLKPLPDPSADRDMLLLASIEVGVKAVQGKTVAELRKRLAPCGFYLPSDLSVLQQPSSGDRLHLENLFEREWDNRTSKYGPLHLKFKKLAIDGAAPEDPPTRRRQVTIFHYDGRARPMTFAVEVPKEATIQQIAEEAAPLAGLDPQSEHFVPVTLGSSLSLNFLRLADKVGKCN